MGVIYWYIQKRPNTNGIKPILLFCERAYKRNIFYRLAKPEFVNLIPLREYKLFPRLDI